MTTQKVFAAVLLLSGFGTTAFAQQDRSTVVFWENGFPAADTTAPQHEALAGAIPLAKFSTSAELPNVLPSADLLVLPYGSAFPESDWPSIQAFLQRGGNLLVLGGRPFLRAAYQDSDAKWNLRDESVRFARQLFIDDYRETPASDGLTFTTNPDWPVSSAPFSWKRAWSPLIKLSVKDVYPRQGSAGSLDARVDALVWGDKDKTHLAAPIIQIDHLQNAYIGGRWIFVQAELQADFSSHGAKANLIGELAAQALRGAEVMTLRPRVPLVLPGEPVGLHLARSVAHPLSGGFSLEISVRLDGKEEWSGRFEGPSPGELLLPAAKTKGFHEIEARFLEGRDVVHIYHSGFWVRDEDYLRSGPKLTVNHDYFELDGKPLPVVGTTYMSSEVQRLYFTEPNAYVWDRDMEQIAGNGLNMIRSGWWTDWAGVVGHNGEVTDDALRTMEAFLMTARRHNIPVQFTFFAFLPDVVGGENAYLDPVAVERQRTMVRSVVSRFKDVPFLAYDLINEPSFSQHTWRTRPNGDNFEAAAWSGWVKTHYPDEAALRAAWNLPAGEALKVPSLEEFELRGAYTGHNALKLHDFYLFAQDTFTAWVQRLRDDIRQAGSKQLITVGQDDGGIADRMNPAFFGDSLDFTTNHTWWLNNELLWCSLVAKQPSKPMLIQETGLQRELTQDERARRSDENEAALFERKVATSFIGGAGSLEWLWNLNALMSEDNEVPIGAVRTDGTMKPEGRVLRDMAGFVTANREHFRGMKRPDVAIVTSQVMQYSVLNGVANLAQQRAVRALVYGSRLPAYVVAENRLAELGTPKLAILPSPQGMSEAGWQALMNYVRGGGALLVTGPVARDEHWHIADKLAAAGVKGELTPLTFSEHTVMAGATKASFHFDLGAQNLLEWERMNDAGFTRLDIGKGRLMVVDAPIELSTDLDAIAAVYSAVAKMAGVEPPFTLSPQVSSGVMVYPQELEDSVLYIFASEIASDSAFTLHDARVHSALDVTLPSQRAAMMLVRKADGAVLASYPANTTHH